MKRQRWRGARLAYRTQRCGTSKLAGQVQVRLMKPVTRITLTNTPGELFSLVAFRLKIGRLQSLKLVLKTL